MGLDRPAGLLLSWIVLWECILKNPFKDQVEFSTVNYAKENAYDALAVSIISVNFVFLWICFQDWTDTVYEVAESKVKRKREEFSLAF